MIFYFDIMRVIFDDDAPFIRMVVEAIERLL